MLVWGKSAQGHNRAVAYVGPHPLSGDVLKAIDVQWLNP